MSPTAHLQQHRPEPGRCFLHNRDQNIPDQVRHHTIGAVNELGVSGKEDSSGSRAQITKSHRRGKEHRARVSLLQTSYLGRNSLPAISVVSEFSHDRSQLTAVNTLAPRICTRTLLTVVIAGNTDIAFLMTHADGGMNLRVRGASVVDCSLVAEAMARATDDTGRRQCGLAGVLGAGALIAAGAYFTGWSRPLHVGSGSKRARLQE
jgi:hypothetical protein